MISLHSNAILMITCAYSLCNNVFLSKNAVFFSTSKPVRKQLFVCFDLIANFNVRVHLFVSLSISSLVLHCVYLKQTNK